MPVQPAQPRAQLGDLVVGQVGALAQRDPRITPTGVTCVPPTRTAGRFQRRNATVISPLAIRSWSAF